MGHETEFFGAININPPLNAKEIKYLNDFNQSRRMDRRKGSYYAVPGNNMGQTHSPDVYDFNEPPDGQPSLWCCWKPTKDGNQIVWSGNSKFYEAPEWMGYLIKHFLGNTPFAKFADKKFNFLEGHILNGEIFAKGEDMDSIWKIKVSNNQVSRVNGAYRYPFDKKRMGLDLYSEAIMEHKILWEDVKWSRSDTRIDISFSSQEMAVIEKFKLNRIKTQTPQKKIKIF